MMRNALTRRQILALVGASVLLGSACGPGPSPSPTAAPAKPAAPAPTPKPATAPAAKPTTVAPTVAPTPVPVQKLRVGVVYPIFWQAPLYLGKQRGIYAKRGVDLEVEHAANSPNLMKAFLAGQVHAVIVNSLEQITAIENGAEITIIGVFAPGNPNLIYSRDDVPNLKALSGRTIGVTQASGFTQALMMATLDSAGLSTEDVTWLSIGNDAERIRALAAGKIDATLASSEYRDLALANGLKILSVIKNDQPRFINQTVATGNRLLKDNSQLLVRFMAANLESIRYVLTHRDEVVAQETSRLGLRKEEVSTNYDWTADNDIWQPDGYVDPGTLEYMQQLNVRLGFQKAVMPVEKIATWDIQKAALDLAGGPYRSKS